LLEVVVVAVVIGLLPELLAAVRLLNQNLD
jgi:hypothetical protein